MYVYGDITTDARVNRAANALADEYDVKLISTQCGKMVSNGKFENLLIGTSKTGIVNLFKNLFEAYRIIKHERPDIVYCHDYYSALLAYFLIGRKYCKKIIYDAHELIIPEPNAKDSRLAFFGWFEKRIIKRVDLAICASEARGEKMAEYYHLTKVPLVIHNISQLEINADEDTNRILEELKDFFSNPVPTVVYAGVVTKSRRIIDLEEAVSSLAPKYKLLVVGQGDVLDEVVQKASENKDLTFAYTGKIPYRSLGAVLRKCDIGFVYYPTNTLNNTYCASNKLYEYASVGLPMIANTNPTIEKELRDNQLGVASDNLVEAIEKTAANLLDYKQSCRTYTENNPWSKDAELLLNKILCLL